MICLCLTELLHFVTDLKLKNKIVGADCVRPDIHKKKAIFWKQEMILKI